MQTIEPEKNNYIVDTLPHSLRQLIEALSQTRYVTTEKLRQLILEAKIQEEELLPWATFNHPITDSYGRKLVYDGGYFEVMVMSWIPGDISAIHDHGFTQWGAVQSFGKARHITYKLNKGCLQTQKEMWFHPYQVSTVNHDLIHQMGNIGDSFFLSLHVYGCCDRNHSITSDARIFDLLEGCIQYTNGGVFFCLPESEISQRCYPLEGDLATTLSHHQQMQERVNRVLKHPIYSSQQWQLKGELLTKKIQELKSLTT